MAANKQLFDKQKGGIDMLAIKVSQEKALEIIETREPRGLFYSVEDNGYIVGIDNTTSDAWTEDFTMLADCINWLDR